jgi:protein-S-isoprenylcysteine O-methyltransferase Ste14
MKKRIVQVLFLVLLQAAALFGAAGTLRWTAAWVYFLLYGALIAANAVLLPHRNPELVEERAKLHADAKDWDRWIGWLGLFAGFSTLLLAGLDQRLGLTPSQPIGLSWLGGMMIAFGHALFVWAMVSNRFFSTQVRIQHERGHQVVETGPYHYIRHPGYAGMLLGALGLPLLLGSWWAWPGAALTVLLILMRTYLEDRTLQLELPGYASYARRTTARLIPRLW